MMQASVVELLGSSRTRYLEPGLEPYVLPPLSVLIATILLLSRAIKAVGPVISCSESREPPDRVQTCSFRQRPRWACCAKVALIAVVAMTAFLPYRSGDTAFFLKVG